MKKGDVGTAKCFSKKYRKKGWAFDYLQSESYVKMHVSAWCYIPSSLPPEPLSIFYYLKLNSGIGHYEVCSQPIWLTMPPIKLEKHYTSWTEMRWACYRPLSAQCLNSTKYWWFGRQWCIRRWQASWHNFQIVDSWKLIPCFRSF